MGPKFCPEMSATNYQPHAASHFKRAEIVFHRDGCLEITQVYLYFGQSMSVLWWGEVALREFLLL